MKRILIAILTLSSFSIADTQQLVIEPQGIMSAVVVGNLTMQKAPTILVKDLESTLSRSYYKGKLEILEVKYIMSGDAARQMEIELIDHPRSPKLPVICLSQERIYDVNSTSGVHSYLKVSLPEGVKEGRCALVIRRCMDLLKPYYIIEEAHPLEEGQEVEVKSTNNYLKTSNQEEVAIPQTRNATP